MAVQIVKPRIRGFICTNAHPAGCQANIQNQIALIKESTTHKDAGLNALVIGASTGYGLASRIALTWGYGAKTLGLLYERPAMTAALHQQAITTPLHFTNKHNMMAFLQKVSTEMPFRMM